MLDLNRRELLALALQHAHQSASDPKSARFTALSADDARDVEALAARIIPSEPASPGAREAGVVYFIDRALATFDANKRPLYTAGLAEFRRVKPSDLDAYVKSIESTPFFDTLRTHTVLGFLGHPRYGGNRDRLGWKHIGFEDRGVHTPPFGYYDAQ